MLFRSRCGTVVEPRLSLQWFVKVGPLAKAAGDAVRDGRTTIEPASLAPRYFEWVDNMHDWCISRQLWWGHQIPVWYSPSGDDVVSLGPGEARLRRGSLRRVASTTSTSQSCPPCHRPMTRLGPPGVCWTLLDRLCF